ncbi:hypothetical protein PHLGIDRAFT_487889 [Phlebiopsis gigantea 11061_1 CR5-6]|uniref:Uncharacterized protein n=1 Tax=Phlebiopsis gigantea (strain 11061_1 CR5-6) TaxID=745531 RepID=A0A0C3NKZ7_PHLG1|nr:hypothetical protein PHLGIDRAFT_487889 [Phlebiopsis gigantea 11061_1 CR5-6]
MTSMYRLSLGPEIPPEVLDCFVYFLSGGHADRFWDEEPTTGEPPPLNVTKRNLGLCSLVCKRWAKGLRGKIFGGLTLRSHDDARTFIDLVHSTFWPEDLSIAPHLILLNLRQDIRQCSWVHNVMQYAPCFKSLLPKLLHVTLVLWSSYVEGEPETPFPKTIYHHLPLTLPPAPFYGLTLQKSSFSSVDHLISLIASTSLAELRFQSPRWEGLLMSSNPIKQLRPTRKPLTYIIVTESTASDSETSTSLKPSPMGLLVWLLATARHLPQALAQDTSQHMRIIHTARSEISAMAKLIQSSWGSCQCALCAYRLAHPSSFDGSARLTVDWRYDAPRSGYPNLAPLALVSSGSGHHVLDFSVQDHEWCLRLSPQGNISQVEFNLGNLGKFYRSSGLDVPNNLTAFFEHLNFDFPSLDKVIADLDLPHATSYKVVMGHESSKPRSVRSCLAAEAVRLKMPRVQRSGRLEVEIRNSLIAALKYAPDVETEEVAVS